MLYQQFPTLMAPLMLKTEKMTPSIIISNSSFDFSSPSAKGNGKQEGPLKTFANPLYHGFQASAKEIQLGGMLPPSPDWDVKDIRIFLSETSDLDQLVLIIDLDYHSNPDGTEWHGWNLKPDIRTGVEHLGILRG